MANHMKIAMVGFRFACSTGERNTHVWEEYAKLYPHDEVHIFTGRRYLWDSWEKKLDPQPLSNLYVHQRPIWFSRWGQFKYMMPTMIWDLIRVRPDYIYAAEEPIQPFMTWMMAIYAVVTRTPYCTYTYENQYRKWWFPISLFEKVSVKMANKVVCASRKAEEILQEKYQLPGNHFVVFPETGIDLRVFSKKTLRKDREDTVLFMGRLLPEKGIKEMLAAKKILDKKGKKYKWIFVGSGEMQEYIKNNQGDNCELIPWIPREEVPSYLNRAKVFLYPSLQTPHWEEQFGYLMAESIACGTPVISTPNTGAKEILPEEWMFVPFGDSVNLAKRIETVMAMKDEFDWSAYLEKRFSLSTIAKKWHKLFMMSR